MSEPHSTLTLGPGWHFLSLFCCCGAIRSKVVSENEGPSLRTLGLLLILLVKLSNSRIRRKNGRVSPLAPENEELTIKIEFYFILCG